MAEPYTLFRGANVLLSRPLLQEDGATALLCSSLVVCECELMQFGKVVKKLVRGTDPELRNGNDGQSLELEITTAISATLKAGPLAEVYKLGVADAEYAAEPGKRIPKIAVTQVTIA